MCRYTSVLCIFMQSTMMLSFRICLLSLATLTSNIHGHLRCNSFLNVKMTVHSVRSGVAPFPAVVNGCIERIEESFENETISEIYVRDQKIPTLGRDSVRNMVKLSTVSFRHCQLDAIEPEAFRNVPRLKTVQLSHGNLATLPVGVFTPALVPSLEKLQLDHNKIARIDEGALANLYYLRRLYLNNNLLTEWNGRWFSNCSVLQLVDLSFNKITVVPSGSFVDVPRIKQIMLDFNDIETIHAGAFEAVDSLDYLGLKYNKLTLMDHSMFPAVTGGVSIGTLALDANRLNFLPREFLGKIKRLDVLGMAGNPWTCPCMIGIHRWLYEHNATLQSSVLCSGGDVPVCSYSDDSSRSCGESVDEKVTRTFLTAIRRLSPPLDQSCVRLN